jgi:hypothetical protein
MAKEKRVNIGISEDIHTHAKVISVLKNIPLGKYFEKAIEEAVKRDKNLLKQIGK